MHEAVVVFDLLFQQQIAARCAELPPRRDVTGWRPALQRRNQIDAFVEDGLFLLRGQRQRIFMTVAVNAYLVPGLRDGFHLLRKCLDRVPRNEPGRLYAKTFKQLEQTRTSDLAGEYAA